MTTLPPFEALKTRLHAVAEKQLALNWNPPALTNSLRASLESVAELGATIKVAFAAKATASANASASASASAVASPTRAPKASRPTDALSLGVGVSVSAAASISAGISLGVKFSASASLHAQLTASLHLAISLIGDLERALAVFNLECSLVAGYRGVMPAGLKIELGPVNRSLRGLSERLIVCQSKASSAAAAKPVAPIEAELRLPRIGAWHCSLDIDSTATQKGKISFKLDEFEFTGTVVPEHSGVDGSRAKCKVIAGNGNINNEITAHSYSHTSGVMLGAVVRDILKECGEDLSDLADKDALSRRVPRWHTLAGKASQALTQLAEKNGCAWRMMRDGTVWFGEERWPEVAPAGTQTGGDWADGSVTLASETPNMVPGTVYEGRKVEDVTHRYGRTLRTEIRTVSPGSALAGAFKRRQHEIDYSREYPCKVVSQNPDGTLQLLPDDAIMKASGLDHVPIRYGMPGMKATIASGARCHLAFAAGDPARPFVCSWEYDPEKVTLVSVLDGERSFARVGDIVQGGGPGTVCTLFPLPVGVGAPPNNAIVAGMPCLISFSAEPLTPATLALQVPLFSAIAGGIAKFQG